MLAILQSSLSFSSQSSIAQPSPITGRYAPFLPAYATMARELGSTIRPRPQGQATNNGERRKLVATTVLTAQTIKLSIDVQAFGRGLWHVGKEILPPLRLERHRNSSAFGVLRAGITGKHEPSNSVHQETDYDLLHLGHVDFRRSICMMYLLIGACISQSSALPIQQVIHLFYP